MWGGNNFPGFPNDPFFQPFPGFNQSPFAGMEHPSMRGVQGHGLNRADQRVVARPDDMFVDPFAHMNRMMQEMSRGFGSGMMMQPPDMMQQLGNNGHSYSYSSVMSFSNVGADGQPKVFEATSSTRQGPGGVKETRKTVRDSESGVNKMAIGHHINERGHIVERRVNKRTNERDEHENFINMDETDAGRFNEEWSRATRNLNPTRGIEDRRRAPPRNNFDGGQNAIDY